MSYGTSQTANQRTITAFFDKRQDADEAIQRLVSEGVSRTSINIVEGSQSSTQGSTAARSPAEQEGMGFWDVLKDLFLPDEDRSTYAEGLRRGGYLVTVRTADANYARALDILDDEGTIDLDERAASWRSEGWTGYTGPAYRPGTVGAGSTAAGSGTPGSAGASNLHASR